VIGQFFTLTASSTTVTAHCRSCIIIISYLLFSEWRSNGHSSIVHQPITALEQWKVSRDRCLEAFHCSSAVSGWWSIGTWPNGTLPQRPVPRDFPLFKRCDWLTDLTRRYKWLWTFASCPNESPPYFCTYYFW